MISEIASWVKGLDPWLVVAMTALTAALWRQIKFGVKTLANRLVATEALDAKGTALFLSWARDNYKLSRFSPRQYYGVNLQMRDERQSRLVMFQILAGMDQIFWRPFCKGWVNLPILTNKSERKAKGDGGNVNYSGYNLQQITVRYIRGTLDMAEILRIQAEKVTEAAHNARNSNRFSVHHIIGEAVGMFSLMDQPKEEHTDWDHTGELQGSSPDLPGQGRHLSSGLRPSSLGCRSTCSILPL